MTLKNKLSRQWHNKKHFLDHTIFFTMVSIFLGLVIGAIVLAVVGFNPFEAYWIIIKGVFSRPKYIVYTIIKAVPIIVTGYSVAFAFRTGLFNIGAEGQFLIGSITAALAGYFLHLPIVIHALTVFLLAVMAAALWGGLAGYLKARFGVHEVISTIMLNWIALYLNNYLVMLPSVKRPHAEASWNILDTARIDLFGAWKVSEAGMAWRLEHPFFHDILQPEINLGIFVAGLLGILTAFVLNKTTLGYELRAVGFNKDAAEQGGINVKKNFVVAMAIAGGLAGAAGALNVLGVARESVNLANMEGYGFDGITVALIGSNTSIGCFFSGLFFGALKYSGAKLQSTLGAPKEIISIVMGTILFFVAMPKLIQLLRSMRSQKKKETTGV
ncbi:MAG: ABC transporter permease [Desulfobacteraceae bacterium]|nr:MAG: ABC transporter permease [Desulfobacteraceae bacterium]